MRTHAGSPQGLAEHSESFGVRSALEQNKGRVPEPSTLLQLAGPGNTSLLSGAWLALGRPRHSGEGRGGVRVPDRGRWLSLSTQLGA